MKPLLIALLLASLLAPVLAQGQSINNKARAQPPEPAPSAVVDNIKRDPRKFAVLSVLGDNVQLISLTPARGDGVQPGDWTASPTGGLDNAVLKVLDESIKAGGPGREVKLYTTSTRSLFGDPAQLFVGSKLALPGQLGDAVRQSGAGWLLLVTRNRQDAALAALLPPRIQASLDGPGFVLDQRPGGQIGFDGQGGLPVLAAFMSIRVALVDLGDLQLKREQSIAVAARLPVGREAAANPWAALPVNQRVKALEALIEAELPRAVKGLVVP